jgi:hypothetical protein
MAQERDSILRLRAKVDSHDKYEESLIDTAPAALTDPSDNRIVLCAPQRPFRLRQVSLGRLAQDFEFENFGSSLAKFFRLYGGLDVTQPRLESCGVSIRAENISHHTENISLCT